MTQIIQIQHNWDNFLPCRFSGKREMTDSIGVLFSHRLIKNKNKLQVLKEKLEFNSIVFTFPTAGMAKLFNLVVISAPGLRDAIRRVTAAWSLQTSRSIWIFCIVSWLAKLTFSRPVLLTDGTTILALLQVLKIFWKEIKWANLDYKFIIKKKNNFLLPF